MPVEHLIQQEFNATSLHPLSRLEKVNLALVDFERQKEELFCQKLEERLQRKLPLPELLVRVKLLSTPTTDTFYLDGNPLIAFDRPQVVIHTESSRTMVSLSMRYNLNP